MSKVPLPPSADDNAMVRESHHLVRERGYDVSSLPRLLMALKNESATGTLLVEFNQGGVRAVRFREEQRIFNDRAKNT